VSPPKQLVGRVVLPSSGALLCVREAWFGTDILGFVICDIECNEVIAVPRAEIFPCRELVGEKRLRREMSETPAAE
jgi:hypothetical protein